MITLFVTAGSVPKNKILECFELNKIEFINNSCPEDEYKLKSYAFHGNISDLSIAIPKIKAISGYRIKFALIELGARIHLIETDGL